MKFLFWQFAAYALAAFVLGAITVSLWWRPEVARRRLVEQRLRDRLVAAQRENETVRAERDAHEATINDLGVMRVELDEVRRAMALLGADLEAATIKERQSRREVQNLETTIALLRRASDTQGASRVELDALREELDRRLSVHRRERELLISARTAAITRAEQFEDALNALRMQHDALVVSSQKERTELALRIERLERERIERDRDVIATRREREELHGSPAVDERDASWAAPLERPIAPYPRDTVNVIDATSGTISLGNEIDSRDTAEVGNEALSGAAEM